MLFCLRRVARYTLRDIHSSPQADMSTHTRIRKFNTKETYPNQSLDNDLCQAVRAGNTVYVRGQIGTDFEGNLVGPGGPAAPAEPDHQSSSGGIPAESTYEGRPY